MSERKLLIDTDIGDDIDDVFALYDAMRLSFDLVGVTTGYRNTKERARLAKKLMRSYGCDYESVPVYVGYHCFRSDEPEPFPHLCQYTEALADPVYAPDGETPADAVAFLLECCRKYGNRLTILAIGPFGNLAKALEHDPVALNGIDRVVIMGGAFYQQYIDWNVLCDVPAADYVFRNLNNLQCLGADVTHELTLNDEEQRQLWQYSDQDAAMQEILRCYRMWKSAYPDRNLVLNDVLAVRSVRDPLLCTFENACVCLLTEGYAKGLTFRVDALRYPFLNDAYRDFDFKHRIRIAATVDRDRFWRSFLQTFQTDPQGRIEKNDV